jgi:hypothetical protein
VTLFPDAAQHGAKRSDALLIRDLIYSEFAKIPGLQRTASRCAAPGKRG